MGESSYTWAYVAIMTVVPAAIAFLFFRVFPSSRAVVKGPLKGLDLKVGGAFGGYFAAAVLLWALLPRPTRDPDIETWNIKGWVRLQDGRPAGACNVSATLPDGGVAANGQLTIRGVAVPTHPSGGVISITIRQGDTLWAQVPLTNDPPKIAVPDTYRMDFQREDMVIEIDPAIVLRRTP